MLLVAALPGSACGGTDTGAGGSGGTGGSTPAPGTLTCASVLGGGPTVTPAERGLLPGDFATVAASQAYADLQGCACTGGCASVCDERLDGTGVPNYCNDSVAVGPCASCLHATCGELLASCSLN